jgi:hypothetical protein
MNLAIDPKDLQLQPRTPLENPAVQRWLNRPYGQAERVDHERQAGTGKVIPCPCVRCKLAREQAALVKERVLTRQQVVALTAKHHALTREKRLVRALVAVIGLQIAWYSLRRAVWWLQDAPARFEAWVDSVDAAAFIRGADKVFAIVFLLIIAAVVFGCLGGLLTIILEGHAARP